MSRWLLKIRTALRLGLPNVAKLAAYRLGMRLGVHPVLKLRADIPVGPFFVLPAAPSTVMMQTVTTWEKTGQLFGFWPMPLTDVAPDWLADPFTGNRVSAARRPWWQIPDFDPTVGDIKLIWELSRFDWVLAFAQRAANGDAGALQRLNDWLADWCRNNPPYLGANWKCGQEASIRVMHLSMAMLMLGQSRTATTGLLALVRMHLQRIAPTVSYAMAQDNNHGTSEAAALFMGGSWLAEHGHEDGVRWMRAGRKWLENRAARLIGKQGSFSQYSLNYHRVMLDTFCMAEVWRRHLELPAFSARWQARATSAAQWLRHMVNHVNGDGPNVGANDGARLLTLTGAAYRDFRPSVQLAMALFSNEAAYAEDGSWNSALAWLRVELPLKLSAPVSSYIADDGGFAALHKGEAMAMLRYPRFKFRPSQADALHLDLWVNGTNLLRDGGTYSYNTDPQWLAYFGGTSSHNTVQFDERDQMPRISRFLLGDWLKTTRRERLHEDEKTARFGAGYTDSRGAKHYRRVTLEACQMKVSDNVSDFVGSAVLRWRLAPGAWTLTIHASTACVTSTDYPGTTLLVAADVDWQRCALVDGWESRHYLEKTQMAQACTITTNVSWSA
jgi:hypothetical protein